MIHVVKLKKTIEYEVRYDEDFEGEHEELTKAEAVTAAKDDADECVFLSWDDDKNHELVTKHPWELVTEHPWELVSHEKKEADVASNVE